MPITNEFTQKQQQQQQQVKVCWLLFLLDSTLKSIFYLYKVKTKKLRCIRRARAKETLGLERHGGFEVSTLTASTT